MHTKIVLFLALSITLYAAKFTKFSPIYIIYLFLLFAGFISCAISPKLKLSSDSYVALCLIAYLLVSQFGNYLTGEFINIFISLVAYIYIRSTINYLDTNRILSYFNLMLFLNISILVIDTIIRFSNPGAPTSEALNIITANKDLWFYNYKFGSILFADSNTVGLVAMILFFATITINYQLNTKVFKKQQCLLLLLIALSFSRSSIIATAFGLFYYYFVKSKLSVGKILVGISVLIAIAISVEMYLLPSNDGSFSSKVNIFNHVLDYYNRADLSELFTGIGLSKSLDRFNIHTHSLYLTYFVETGILGFLLFMLFVIVYIKKYDFFVLFPVLISSLSYFLYVGTPFLFTPLALVANFLDMNENKVR